MIFYDAVLLFRYFQIQSDFFWLIVISIIVRRWNNLSYLDTEVQESCVQLVVSAHFVSCESRLDRVAQLTTSTFSKYFNFQSMSQHFG